MHGDLVDDDGDAGAGVALDTGQSVLGQLLAALGSARAEQGLGEVSGVGFDEHARRVDGAGVLVPAARERQLGYLEGLTEIESPPVEVHLESVLEASEGFDRPACCHTGILGGGREVEVDRPEEHIGERVAV